MAPTTTVRRRNHAPTDGKTAQGSARGRAATPAGVRATPRRERRQATKTPALTGPSEDQIQIALFQWLDLQHPDIAPWAHHSPAGGARSAVTGARFKAMGVRRGFPDFALYVPRAGFCGLAIELKAAKGRPTTEQIEWLDHLASAGWMAALCSGFDAARDTIAEYLACRA